jgi:glycosyltransferase involved in cell wall biosynthesis
MKKTALSVVLATRNEEANIGRCLESIKHIADEIIIADEKSTDDTVQIAKKYGARVISVEHQENFHITKNIAIDAATGDWILQLDADEVVPPELSREIQSEISRKSNINGYWINRKNWFLTRFLTKGGQYPDPTLRLYRRGFGRLPAQDVHEQAVVQGPTGHLRHDLYHYRDITFAKYLEGFNRYSSLLAMQMEQQKLHFGLWQTFNHLAIKPLTTFIKIYLRHRGYVDGFPGFVFALFSGLIHSIAYIKYWQHKYYPETSPLSPLLDKERGTKRGEV